jgi:hypothetical protein
VDWHCFDADPNLTFHFEADPYPESGSYPKLENQKIFYFYFLIFLVSAIGVMIFSILDTIIKI